jgi:hypothetical protein
MQYRFALFLCGLFVPLFSMEKSIPKSELPPAIESFVKLIAANKGFSLRDVLDNILMLRRTSFAHPEILQSPRALFVIFDVCQFPEQFTAAQRSALKNFLSRCLPNETRGVWAVRCFAAINAAVRNQQIGFLKDRIARFFDEKLAEESYELIPLAVPFLDDETTYEFIRFLLRFKKEVPSYAPVVTEQLLSVRRLFPKVKGTSWQAVDAEDTLGLSFATIIALISKFIHGFELLTIEGLINGILAQQKLSQSSMRILQKVLERDSSFCEEPINEDDVTLPWVIALVAMISIMRDEGDLFMPFNLLIAQDRILRLLTPSEHHRCVCFVLAMYQHCLLSGHEKRARQYMTLASEINKNRYILSANTFQKALVDVIEGTFAVDHNERVMQLCADLVEFGFYSKEEVNFFIAVFNRNKKRIQKHITNYYAQKPYLCGLVLIGACAAGDLETVRLFCKDTRLRPVVLNFLPACIVTSQKKGHAHIVTLLQNGFQ